ncbi:hypothetical protein HN446_04430 [bacterium]|nr:hypothetical protein [bacterium]
MKKCLVLCGLALISTLALEAKEVVIPVVETNVVVPIVSKTDVVTEKVEVKPVEKVKSVKTAKKAKKVKKATGNGEKKYGVRLEVSASRDTIIKSAATVAAATTLGYMCIFKPELLSEGFGKISGGFETGVGGIKAGFEKSITGIKSGWDMSMVGVSEGVAGIRNVATDSFNGFKEKISKILKRSDEGIDLVSVPTEIELEEKVPAPVE